MKNFFILSSLYILLIALASWTKESGPFRYLFINENKVIFEKVFETTEQNPDQLKSFTAQTITILGAVTDVRINEHSITARIHNDRVDYKKYGVSDWSVDMLLNHPFMADVTILFREGRYRVTVSNIVFLTPPSIGETTAEDAFFKMFSKSKQQWTSNKSKIRAGLLLERYLSDKFLLEAMENTRTDW